MEEPKELTETTLSKFEIVFSSHPPILEALLLHTPTPTIFQLYHTSSYLRRFLRSYPTAWKYLSFRLLQPSATPAPPVFSHTIPSGSGPRQSRNYALDQLLLTVINPFSSCLKSLELDNTAVSGQILISTVLSLRRETLEHLSVRGCKNVSLKYHIIPWLTLFSLQRNGQGSKAKTAPAIQELALKSLYTYRCRHHRRRPYLPSSLFRKDSDSEPTHDLVNLCHQLNIWTDTAWCTTPGVRCFRRRGYNAMRASVDPREVWVVFDRLWRSKNWVGQVDDLAELASCSNGAARKDGRLWEQNEDGLGGEAVGVRNDTIRYSDGKNVPMHRRQTHREFVEKITCDTCSARILERCEQCSVLMHCVGCRKTLCASCAFDRPYTRRQPPLTTLGDDVAGPRTDKFWWAPGCAVSPCLMQDTDEPPDINGHSLPPPNPSLKLRWCCIEPVFSGGGGITLGPGNQGREFDRMRAAPLPKGAGWEDPEFGSNPRTRMPSHLAQERLPSTRTQLDKVDHYDVMHKLLGAEEEHSAVPRNLCDECYESRHWKAQCSVCSQALCLQHDLRGLRMRVCGYRDLASEKESLARRQQSLENMAVSLGKMRDYVPPEEISAATNAWHNDVEAGPCAATMASEEDGEMDTKTGELAVAPAIPIYPLPAVESALVDSSMNASDNPDDDVGERPNRPGSPSSTTTAAASRSTSPSPSVDSVAAPTPRPTKSPHRRQDSLEPHPKWSGCLSFSCPQFRPAGDHRIQCNAFFRECESCKVNVCSTCADKMPKPCGCDGCAERPRVDVDHGSTATVPTFPLHFAGTPLPTHGQNNNPPLAGPLLGGGPVHAVAQPGGGGGGGGGGGIVGDDSAPEAPVSNKFWCPNCRWERVLVGHCQARQQKKKMAKSKGKGKATDQEGNRRRSRGSMRRGAGNMPLPTGIDDETARSIAEFEDLVLREEAAVHGESQSAAKPEVPETTPTTTTTTTTTGTASTAGPAFVPPASSALSTGDDSTAAILSEAPTEAEGSAMHSPGAEERDLDRISAMVGDLQSRIEKLRVVYASRRESPTCSQSHPNATAISEDIARTTEAAASAAAAVVVGAEGSDPGGADTAAADLVAPEVD